MKKILGIVVASLYMLSMTSCLKDKGYDNHETGHDLSDVPKIIEIGYANEVDHTKTLGFDYADAPIDITLFYVRLASGKPATEDITVTLDTTGGGAKLLDLGADSSFLFTSHYTDFSGLQVTIPKGSFQTAVTAKSNAIRFDPSTLYGVYAKIASVDKSGYTISQNFVDYATLLGAKNDYDGLYEITGTCVDANGLYTGDYGDPAAPRQYSLATLTATSGLFYDVSWDYPNYIVVNISTGGGANTGIRPRLTFDPSSNVVLSVANHNNPATVITVQAGSRFNPGDHSIDLHWIAGRWNVTEHWEYLGPR